MFCLLESRCLKLTFRSWKDYVLCVIMNIKYTKMYCHYLKRKQKNIRKQQQRKKSSWRRSVGIKTLKQTGNKTDIFLHLQQNNSNPNYRNFGKKMNRAFIIRGKLQGLALLKNTLFEITIKHLFIKWYPCLTVCLFSPCAGTSIIMTICINTCWNPIHCVPVQCLLITTSLSGLWIGIFITSPIKKKLF